MKNHMNLLCGMLMLLFLFVTYSYAEGEFLIDTNVVNLNSQYNPAVAFDGTNYLVVWEDTRNANWDIYGARVDQAGNILDPLAIRISTAANNEYYPSVCFSGSDYLVVWQAGSWGDSSDIYGARINQAGVVLDPTGIAISTAAGTQRHPSIAFDGINHLVVWEDGRVWPPWIYGARVNQGGIVIDPNGIAISPYCGCWRPAIAFDGANYLVVWTEFIPPPDASQIQGIRVDTAGTLIDSVINIPRRFQWGYHTSVAFDGTNYFVVYLGVDSTYSCFLYGARVDQSGYVLDTMGIVISSIYFNNTNLIHPSVVFDGTHYVVAWNDSLNGYSFDFDLYGAKLNTSGVVIDSFTVSRQEGEQGPPALASGVDNQVLITYSGWTDSIGGNPVDRMRIWGKFYPFVGIVENPTAKNINKSGYLGPTLLSGPLLLPADKSCKVFDITGRVVMPNEIKPGIYFIEIDGKITRKIVKVR